ncbi:prepilin-type N-terminal cleavage/methylation domain-containing protein [Virgibacillus massiliensis]|nr:prepilin-type N-terminal cleavage/methylation domain-containing protein [Virgibacillus massiliensis]
MKHYSMIKTQEKFVLQPAKRNGFSLIEMLVVLSIVMVLLGISVPPALSILEELESQYVLQTFETDVMKIQHMSAIHQSRIRIFLYEDKYAILHNSAIKITRLLPTGWKIDSTISRNIEFERNGNIKQPRTFYIQAPNKTYKVVFPFGKGRFRIEET